MRKKPGFLLTTLLVLAACTNDADIIVLPDPSDPLPATAPLVTVIYDPDALGDKAYNDLIYQGVEKAAGRYGLRTMQLSPQNYQEGLAYIETMCTAVDLSREDTVRRLYIVAGTSYDAFLRQHSHVFDDVPSADLLYLETRKPLESKGSTFFMPYYGAMYEAGALMPLFCIKVAIIASNPEDETVAEAIRGFIDGYNTDYYAPDTMQWGPNEKKTLRTIYLAEHAGQGYNIADTTALKLIHEPYFSYDLCVVPICGGSGRLISYLMELLTDSEIMGVDVRLDASISNISVLKHIDRAVEQCIGQWLSPQGMPKHQTFGLSQGYTEVVIHPHTAFYKTVYKNQHNDALDRQLHEDAIRKEETYGEK